VGIGLAGRVGTTLEGVTARVAFGAATDGIGVLPLWYVPIMDRPIWLIALRPSGTLEGRAGLFAFGSLVGFFLGLLIALTKRFVHAIERG
jgi:hypothetical protein